MMPGDEGRLGQGCGGEAFSVGLERSARKAHSCANSKRTVPNGIGGRVFAADAELAVWNACVLPLLA
jgi:hypothetical protein